MMTETDSLGETVRTKTRLDALIAIRNYLADRLDENPPVREISPLTRRLTEVLAEIDALSVGDPEPVPDWLEAELRKFGM